MGLYLTMCGSVKYDTREAFDNACHLLADWLTKDGHFVDDCGEIVEENAADVTTLTIDIPYTLHRNLNTVIPEIFRGGKGRIIATSSDGRFAGWIIENGEEKRWELDEWAKAHNFTPAPNEDIDALNIWREQVEESFFRWAEQQT